MFLTCLSIHVSKTQNMCFHYSQSTNNTIITLNNWSLNLIATTWHQVKWFKLNVYKLLLRDFLLHNLPYILHTRAMIYLNKQIKIFYRRLFKKKENMKWRKYVEVPRPLVIFDCLMWQMAMQWWNSSPRTQYQP